MWRSIHPILHLLLFSTGLYAFLCAAPAFFQEAMSRSWPRVPARIIEHGQDFQGGPDAAWRRFRIHATYEFELRGETRKAAWMEPSLFLRSGRYRPPGTVLRVCPENPYWVVPEGSVPGVAWVYALFSALAMSYATAFLHRGLKSSTDAKGPPRASVP